MFITTYEIHVETICLLSYHDPPVESLLSHPVKPTFFGIWMSSCFSFWDTPLWYVGMIQLQTWMTRITHLMMDYLRSSDFSTYHTSDSILGHISSSVEICRSPLVCMIISSYKIHVGQMIYLHFVIILQLSLSWVIQLGSYFFILSWFFDGVILDS